MPSPFPGMDPYIESSGRWGDFHGSMIAAMRKALNERLPDGYAAEIELYVWFNEPDAQERGRQIEPDVYVTDESPRKGRSFSRTMVPEPRKLTFPSVQRKRQKYLRVVDYRSNRVVTIIELLSPSNKKAGDDHEAYLSKRNESLATGVNLVEIDLHRGGRRLPLGNPPPQPGDYYLLVSRAWEYPQLDFWALGLRDSLPDVPVPLIDEQADVGLPLRRCMDEAYDAGKYLSRLPYRQPLTPRLKKRDEAWVERLVNTLKSGDASRAQ
jgi:hypothetical protein